MFLGEIDREYQIDPESIRLTNRRFFGTTYDGRVAELVTSASVVLGAELQQNASLAIKEGHTLITTKRAGLSGDVGPERVKSAIEKMIGKMGTLLTGYDYVLGPIFGTASPEEKDYFEIPGDWGIYRVRRSKTGQQAI